MHNLGIEDMEDDDDMMLDEGDDEFDPYRIKQKYNFQSGAASRRKYGQSSLQGYLDDRMDSEENDEEEMLNHMQESDGDEDMLMDRDYQSDEMEDDDDLNHEYNNFFKMRLGKDKDQFSTIKKKLEKNGMRFSGDFLK